MSVLAEWLGLCKFFSLLLLVFLIKQASAFSLPPICRKIPVAKPRTPINFKETSCEDRVVWFDCALSYYGLTREHVDKYARKNQIPTRLLATVIANELMDYSARDLTQETVYMTMHASAGIAQLQPIRLHKHQLAMPNAEGSSYNYFELWRELTRPLQSLNYAAKEIAWILDALNHSNKIGKDFPRYYIYPGEKIFVARPYDNVKPLRTTQIKQDLYPAWIQKEAALAHAVIMAYNNGALKQQEHIIWRWSQKKYGSPLSENIKDLGLRKPAAHAQNGRYYWATCLAEEKWPNTRQYWFPKPSQDLASPQKGCRWIAKTLKKDKRGKRKAASHMCFCKYRDSRGLIRQEYFEGEMGQKKCGQPPLIK